MKTNSITLWNWCDAVFFNPNS